MSNLKVQCPCCEATLVIDKDTGAVLSHDIKKKETKSLEDFMKEEKNKLSTLEEKFKENQEKEKSKFDILEKKFKHAQENKDSLKEPPPGINWD